MSSLITHLFIPLCILLIFSEKLDIPKKTLIILSFFAIFPDMDMPMFHRATLHNVFVLLAIFLLFLSFKNLKIALIASYYVFSHILLDVFNSGVFVLYPVYNKTLDILAGMSYIKPGFIYTFSAISIDALSDRGIKMQMISSENTATIILVLIVVIAIIIKNKHKTLNSKIVN